LALVIAVGAGAAVVLRILCLHVWPTNYAAWVLMPCRADSLLLGVAGAIAVRSNKLRDLMTRYRWVLFAVFAIGLAGAGVFTLKHKSVPMPSYGFTWMAVFYLSFVLIAVLEPHSVIARPLRWAWLRGLGKIAYGVYLVHPLMLLVASKLIPSQTGAVAVALVATTAICWLSWTYFEEPLIEHGHQLT
jgi:peptidoglycan/LPS O-acetylase OafA/YrhL